MDVILGLIPAMILLGLVAVGVLFWAAKKGQFDDLEGEAHRILMDEDLMDEPQPQKGSEKERGNESQNSSHP